MLIVKVKNGNIEKALKEFKRKFKDAHIMEELRDRMEYKKNSVMKREKRKHAEYVQRMKNNNDE